MTDTPAPPPPPPKTEGETPPPTITTPPTTTTEVPIIQSTVFPTSFPTYSTLSNVPLSAPLSTALVPTAGYSIDDFNTYGYGYGVPYSRGIGVASPYLGGFGGAYGSPISSAYTPPTSMYGADYSRGFLPYGNYAPRGKYPTPFYRGYSPYAPRTGGYGGFGFAAAHRYGYGLGPQGGYGSLPPVAPLGPVGGLFDGGLAAASYANPRMPDAYTYGYTPYRPYAGFPRRVYPGWHSKYTQQSWRRGWGA
jgi:hypothetical protein